MLAIRAEHYPVILNNVELDRGLVTYHEHLLEALLGYIGYSLAVWTE
jgi:hypothetical protein